MKLVLPIALLIFYIACEDPCWQPVCHRSTEFRFNILDSAKNDLFFGDSALYSIDQLQIKDSLNNSYPIQSEDYGSLLFVVDLSVKHKHYQIILQDVTLDNIQVTYELEEEECCGLTTWLRQIEFQKLRTEIDENRTIFTSIYLE